MFVGGNLPRARWGVVLPLFLLSIPLTQLVFATPIAGAEFFTTDVNGVRRSTFYPGETVQLRAESAAPGVGPFDIQVNLAYPPEAGRGEVHVGYYPAQFIRAPVIIASYQLDTNAPAGKYDFKVRVSQGGALLQEGYVEFFVGGAPSGGVTPPPPPPPQTPTWMYIALAGGIIGVAVIAAALILRRPKAPAPPVSPAPQPPAGGVGVGGTMAMPGGGILGIPREGTIQLTGPGGETRILTAMFQVGDKIIPISSLPQAFGREDFVGIAPPDALNAISRRAKPQFTVSFDYVNKTFTIEDYNSTNGTLLNGENIKGKGPRPLKDGDIVSPAGLINLRFVSRPAA